jgi:hypothetical protein
VHKVEAGIGAQMKEVVLSVNQSIHGYNFKAGIQQVLAKNRSDIPGSAGDYNPLSHLNSYFQETTD